MRITESFVEETSHILEKRAEEVGKQEGLFDKKVSVSPMAMVLAALGLGGAGMVIGKGNGVLIKELRGISKVVESVVKNPPELKMSHRLHLWGKK